MHTTPRPRPLPPSPFRRIAAPFLSLLLALASVAFSSAGPALTRGDLAPPGYEPPPARTPATPDILLYSEGQTIATLEIGKSLTVVLNDGTPLTHYTVWLEDESGVPIVSQTVKTNAFGRVRLVQLWKETGILGCDPWYTPDPLNYLYANILQAEALLDGREFEVRVGVGTQVLARQPIPLAAGIPQPTAYLSDATACERHIYFAWETMHMSFVHVPLGTDLPTWIFVVPHQETWKEDDPLVDVSSDGINFVVVPGGAGTSVVDIGHVTMPGYYDVIVRYGYNQTFVFDPDTDFVPGPYLPAMDNKSYQPCGIQCPPPPPPPGG